MLGVGEMEAGEGFGVGESEEAAAPPDGPSGTRFLNPASRDYEVDDFTGHLKQMPALRQRVLLALMTELGTSTVRPEFGVQRPRKMGNRFEADMQAAVRAALAHIVNAGEIQIDGVDVLRGAGGRAQVTVRYRDPATPEETQDASVDI